MNCRLCASPLSSERLDLGALPPCNRFSDQPEAVEKFSLAVTGCSHCGLVQLLNSFPQQALQPRLPWIRYNEPEAHLDDVAATVRTLSGADAKALGTGPFDGPLLTRLSAHGIKTEQLDLLQGFTRPTPQGTYPYLETMQAQLRPEILPLLAPDKADIVLCRFLLEHSSDPLASLAALASIARPGGMIVIEVPDSGKFLKRQDYCFLWEEHEVYFVEETLRAMAVAAGLKIMRVDRYEGAREDALVAFLRVPQIIQKQTVSGTGPNPDFAAFCMGFPAAHDTWHSKLKGKKAALIGAGHQAILFVNALELAPHIGWLVDDDPVKTGLYAPGIPAPIIPVAALLEQNPDLCLLAVSPAGEEKLRTRLAPLAARGIPFSTIFA